jgi:hypothetical protein
MRIPLNGPILVMLHKDLQRRVDGAQPAASLTSYPNSGLWAEDIADLAAGHDLLISLNHAATASK